MIYIIRYLTIYPLVVVTGTIIFNTKTFYILPIEWLISEKKVVSFQIRYWLTALNNRRACLLSGTDWIFKEPKSVFATRYGLNI